MKAKVAIFISGGGSNMRALVQDMIAPDHPAEPAVIVSNSQEAGGIAWARERGLPTLIVDHRPFGADRASFEAEITHALSRFEPDLICLAGFMRVLTAAFVEPWTGKIINIHPSLLPKYRGLNTHARALADGESQHGCTVHEVTPELDDGPILGQARVRITPGDTPALLAEKVLRREHELYPAVLRRFAAGDRTPLILS